MTHWWLASGGVSTGETQKEPHYCHFPVSWRGHQHFQRHFLRRGELEVSALFSPCCPWTFCYMFPLNQQQGPFCGTNPFGQVYIREAFLPSGACSSTPEDALCTALTSFRAEQYFNRHPLWFPLRGQVHSFPHSLVSSTKIQKGPKPIEDLGS